MHHHRFQCQPPTIDSNEIIQLTVYLFYFDFDFDVVVVVDCCFGGRIEAFVVVAFVDEVVVVVVDVVEEVCGGCGFSAAAFAATSSYGIASNNL